MASIIILQFPGVQTFVVQKVTGAVSDKIDGNVKIGKVYFVFFNKLILNDISIVSRQSTPLLDSLKKNFGYSDTLLLCNKLSVSFDVQDFLNSKLKINRVYLNGGEFNLQIEEYRRTNLNRIFRINKDAPKDTAKGSLNLLANTLRMSNFRFTMKNHARYVYRGDSIINFADLDIKGIDINISDIHLKSDTLYANINRIHGKDKSGFTLVNLTGKARVSGTEVLVNDLYMADKYSQLNSKYFYMKYSSPKDFSDFINKVDLGLNLNGAYLNFRTIGKMAPALEKSTMAFNLNGLIEGKVKDLKSRNLLVTSVSGHTFADMDIRLDGLPDITRTMAVVDINRSSTDFRDVSKIIASVNGTPVNKFIKGLSPGTNYSFKGSLTGLLDDFVIKGDIDSPLGNVFLDVLFRNERNSGASFNGEVIASNLDAGAILCNDILGKADFAIKSDVLFKKGGGVEVQSGEVYINNLDFNGYSYSYIRAKGSYADNCFDGRISAGDPNLDFVYKGIFTFSKDILKSRYDFTADVYNLNLAALNLDKNSVVSQLKFSAAAKLEKGDGDITDGSIDIKNLRYRGEKGRYNFGNISIRSHNTSDIYTTSFRAPFADAEYSGPEPVNLFVKKVMGMSLFSKLDNYFVCDTATVYRRGQYNLDVHTFNTMDLCQIIDEDLYIENNSQLGITIDSDNILHGELRSGRFAIGKDYIKDFTLSLDASDSSATHANLFSQNIRFAGMRMDSVFVELAADSNIVDAGFNFKNDSTENNSATLLGKVKFNPERNFEFGILQGSQINLEGEQWKFTPAKITIADGDIVIDRFNLYNKNQSLAIDGNISRTDYDSLDFRLSNFNVGIINMFLNRTFNVQGYFSGSGQISDLYREPKVFFDIDGNDVSVYDNEVGKLKMMSRWNDRDKEFTLYLKSSLKDRRTFLATGTYKPEGTYLNLNASLQDLSVSYFEPFLSDIISRTRGSVSGNLNLSGPLDKLALTGEDCRFNNMGFILNFTQVPYTVDGSFDLNEKGIKFKNLQFTDKFGSKGIINGRFIYDYFRNLALDAKVDFTNLQCLDTEEDDNEYFYGSAFATGSLTLKGPLHNITLDIDAVSNKKTSIHIPLSSSATASQTDLLTFVEPVKDTLVDPYDTLSINRSVAVKKKSNLKVGMDVQVTPDAEVMIEIDKSVGDVIKARGNGVIDLSIDPSKEQFDILGDYHVTDGSYHFVLAGLATRDFILEPGGTINFNGDITDTNLDLNAQYSTKTSINALIADTSSISTRRTVNCIIGMQGKMMNPNLTFQIDVPDLDPTTKIRVESALNTQGKMQRQFMALLVTGGFIPDEQSGIANNSSILYSNASEMLSNQINNIFHQLGIPLDLGLNYQPGERGTDIFDVAVSTQLFNNRVLINGNIGNDPYAQDNRNVVGNLDVEIKLDNPGTVRLDLFSHAEDKYSTYNDNNNSQRSGIGIVYQKEFNSFKNLLKGKSKAQKAYEKQERIKRRQMKKARKK